MIFPILIGNECLVNFTVISIFQSRNLALQLYNQNFMRRLIISMHTSLDGFVAGPKGEMDWIKLDDDMFDLVGEFTEDADTALYGRNTYEMMEYYWPTASEKPNATKHDIQHSAWYKEVNKVVLSRSLANKQLNKTTFISEHIPAFIKNLKRQEGKNILLFGSPTVVHLLAQHNLIDEYRLFINPVILGQGIPLFAGIHERIPLTAVSTKLFSSGVIAVHHNVDR